MLVRFNVRASRMILVFSALVYSIDTIQRATIYPQKIESSNKNQPTERIIDWIILIKPANVRVWVTSDSRLFTIRVGSGPQVESNFYSSIFLCFALSIAKKAKICQVTLFLFYSE